MANIFAKCVGSRFCLRIRRNESIQRATRRMDKAPNGIWASFPAAWSFLAWVLSITSSCVCTYVARIVSYSGTKPQGSLSVLFQDQGIGFWGWSSDGTCYSYEINGVSPSFDGSFKAAGAFTTLTDIIGGAVMICLMLGTNFPVKPKQYEILGYASLLVAVLNGCSLIILGSSVCAPDFFRYAITKFNSIDLSKLETSCTLGSGSTMAVFAVVFWVVTAFGCLRTPLASRKREINPLRRRAMKDGEHYASAEHMESLEDNNDSAHRQRQVEYDQRYRQFMGDDGEGAVPGFESIRKDRLSLVPEDEIVGKDVAAVENEFEDEYDGNHSETRSHYSSKTGDDEDDEFHDEEKPLTETSSHSAGSRGIAALEEEDIIEERSLASAANSEIV
mmetsp:Transcript_15293/g.23455  ORF Transcript_15293/g.23455 Transcript_15293/m.23455 type:complete len:389 (-) Transcript_15293:1724-2890(-)